ncbi:sigma factor [Streptomyces roseochromogenus]|uniref:RNA polymerase sigma-70 region 2 domain-containing protein n=1 Tax=Streptomyces roseochromogenus subsp. oscitans DS 12.976 TaxID=1352936 RepID=V6L119_STRRC|nr:sigma factor [Streptomyces roseochromogenus]EST34919.1 hypothetical protein M878_08625 [Streptomyces roseochromogenus subsp. oscitans DS 12.976]
MAIPSATLAREPLAKPHRRYAPLLLRAVTSRTGDFGRAEDLVQEMFPRARQHPEAFEGDADAALPWPLTVARRLTIDQHRMLSRRAQEAGGEEQVESHVHPVHPRENVPRACDVATHIRVPVGTVKSRSHYAIRTLRPVLGRHGFPPQCA